MSRMMLLYIVLGAIGILVVWILCAFPSLLFVKKGYSQNEIASKIIVAHRGGASIGSENTLSCIEKGVVAGADMIEVDIHLSLDGELVVCHDESIDRTTDGEGLIRELTLAQIKAARINGGDERIPTLVEVFDLMDSLNETRGGKCALLIEIKRTNDIYKGIERKLVDLLDHYGMRGEVVVQSFNDTVLETMHAVAPDVRLEKLLFCKLPFLPVIFDGGFTGFSFEKYGYISSFNFFYGGVDDAMIRQIRGCGKGVKIWTLELPADAVNLDVDGIITNRPDAWSKKD